MRTIMLIGAAALVACGTEPTADVLPTRLAFTVQPTTAAQDAAIVPAVAVTVQDASGALMVGATTPVTIAVGNNPGSAVLSGTLTRAAVNGVATFGDLRLDQAGSGYTLTASATGLAGTTSAAFDITGAAPANATRILLTDDPFPYSRVARVDLYFVSVSGSLSPDTGSAGTFVTLATPNRRIDLLGLQGGVTDELGTLTLPAGIITAVRVVIDTDSSSITLKDGRVLTAASSPGIAWQSSAGRPVLNALVHEQIQVPDTGGVVVIVYDVGLAFIPPQVIDPASTDSGFIFSPVLRATDAMRTGSVAGAVRAGSDAGAPVADASLQLCLGNPAWPENTWSTMATARTDSTGTFRFAFVTPSAYWAQFPARASDVYIVVVDPPAGSGLGRAVLRGVQVTAGSETTTGVLVVP